MKTTLALLFLLAITSCQPENHYVIRGSIDADFDGEWLYLVKFMAHKPDVDSALVSKGKFVFEGSIDYPELYVIHNRPDSILGFFKVMLEPTKMKIDIDVEDWSWGSQIDGGPVNKEFNREYRINETALVLLNKETDEKKYLADSTQLIVLDSIQKTAQDKFKKQNIDYIANNPDSPISPYILGSLFAFIPFSESEQILASFSEKNRNTSICLSLQDKLDLMNEYNTGSLELK